MATRATTKPTVDRKRSLAAKKGAVTRARNRELAQKQQLRFRHKVFASSAIGLTLLIAFIGIYNVLNAYAASAMGASIVGNGNRCLDNSNSRLRNGNAVRLYKCNGSNAQKWIVGTDGTIKNVSGNYCIDIAGNDGENTYVQLYKCNASDAQKFIASNGAITNIKNKLVLTAKSVSSVGGGTRIWMKKPASPLTAFQKWTIGKPATTTPTTGSNNGSETSGSTTGNSSSSSATGSTGNTSTIPTQPSSTYIALGKIPVSGLQVGATWYGADDVPKNGHYVLSNLLQGGIKNGGAYNGYDDNGEGACDGKYTRLDNQATWGEDGDGKILGNLPCGTKLEITYHGHTIVAERADTSDGGCSAAQAKTSCSDKGVLRQIDLWWQSAQALCFTDQPDTMTIHVVPSSTPTTVVKTYSASDASTTATCQ